MAMDKGGDWWRGAAIYQIYPRSFQDTTGDGGGDLPGITQHLAHAASLGVGAVLAVALLQVANGRYGL